MQDINVRFGEIRQALELNQAEFGKGIGLTTSGISNIEKGLRNVTDKHVLLLKTAFNVNEIWLRTGKGEMFLLPEIFSLDEYAQKNQLTELELDILKSYMDLNKDVRQAILKTAQQLFAKHAETTATVEENNNKNEVDIEAELERYRKELEDEKKARMLSASQKHETG